MAFGLSAGGAVSRRPATRGLLWRVTFRYRHTYSMTAFCHACHGAAGIPRDNARNTEWEQDKVDDTARNCMLSAAPTHRVHG